MINIYLWYRGFRLLHEVLAELGVSLPGFIDYIAKQCSAWLTSRGCGGNIVCNNGKDCKKCQVRFLSEKQKLSKMEIGLTLFWMVSFIISGGLIIAVIKAANERS
jgi:hypothetical protein